jgi:hydrogenase maturation protease
MRQPLIIGYGNSLRGDDGIGPRIAAAVAERLPAADVIMTHQLTPELAEPVSRASRLILIDAAENGMPGAMTSLPLVSRAGASRPSTHQLDPYGLLALAESLFGARPPATMITVSGASFGLSEDLSPEVARALPMAVDYVVALAGLNP